MNLQLGIDEQSRDYVAGGEKAQSEIEEGHSIVVRGVYTS
jgi:hypothetical protein